MKIRMLTGVFLAIGLTSMAGIAPNTEMIAKVASGELKEARLSWWGFNEQDSTEIIRKALASKATTLVVDRMATPWVTLPVFLKSDFTLKFEEGAEIQAKKGAFKDLNDCLITLDMLSNVKIIGEGKGGILRMHKSDYQGPAYKHGEWRHCIIVLSSNNVLIENMASLESGGDGIYVGHNSRKSKQPYSKDVIIRKCLCDRNHRQGISIIAAVNLLIEDTRMTNTHGTAPAAGIDFEPNHPNEPLVNCVMRNCLTENNQGAGIEFYLPQQNADKGGINSIRIENCISRNDSRQGFCFVTKNYRQDGTEQPFKCDLQVRNVTVEDSKSANFYFEMDAWQDIAVSLKDCVSIDTRKSGKSAPPINVIYSRPAADGQNAIRMAFENVTVRNTVERMPVELTDKAMYGCRKYNISGRVTNIVNGKATAYVYSKENMGRLFPEGDFDELAPYDYRKAALIPSNVEEHVSLPGAKMRHAGNFWIYLTEGKEATFKLVYAKLTQNTGKTAIVELVAPSGKRHSLGNIEFQSTKQFAVKATEGTGIYKVVAQNGNNWMSITETSVPAGFVADTDTGLNMIYMTGTYYFYVPETVKRGLVCFWGDGAAEGAKITVRDPQGKEVFFGDNVTCKQLLVDGGRQSGVWSFTVAAPSKIRLEDLTLKVMGISPYFTSARAAVPVLAK